MMYNTTLTIIASMTKAISLWNQYCWAFESLERVSRPLPDIPIDCDEVDVDPDVAVEPLVPTGVPQAGQKVAFIGSSLPHFAQNAKSGLLNGGIEIIVFIVSQRASFVNLARDLKGRGLFWLRLPESLKFAPNPSAFHAAVAQPGRAKSLRASG